MNTRVALGEKTAAKSVTHGRITAKRLEFLKGNVVRLIPENPDDWHPHGVLCGFDAKTFTVETLSHGRLSALVEPREEFRDVEEVDVDPDLYRKQGMPR